MHTVNISEFRANLLKYLELANTGEAISVTSNGRTLATITPPANQAQEARNKLEDIARSTKIGDVVGPLDEDWEAQA
ncbi:MAG: type II toxin-antitoxin system prevent-host-death family antitoxin [Halioglobus sp.]